MSATPISRAAPRPGAAIPRSGLRSGGGFSVGETGGPAAGAGPATLAGTAGLLALQAAGQAPGQAAAQGHAATPSAAQQAGLRGLKRLQLALLDGRGLPAEDLAALAGTVDALQQEGGEAASIGRAIALRMRVELARRDVARKQDSNSQ